MIFGPLLANRLARYLGATREVEVMDFPNKSYQSGVKLDLYMADFVAARLNAREERDLFSMFVLHIQEIRKDIEAFLNGGITVIIPNYTTTLTAMVRTYAADWEVIGSLRGADALMPGLTFQVRSGNDTLADNAMDEAKIPTLLTLEAHEDVTAAYFYRGLNSAHMVHRVVGNIEWMFNVNESEIGDLAVLVSEQCNDLQDRNYVREDALRSAGGVITFETPFHLL